MMKYFKYFLGTVVLLGLLFFIKGYLTPTVTYSSEFVVDKPMKEVWAVMNDESKLDQWLTGMKKMEHISGEKGTVGAVTKYTYDENGQESVIIETIKAIRPNEHIAMDFEMEGAMKMDYKMDSSIKEGKTHMKSVTIAKGTGWFMRSMLSFMTNAMKTQEDENMNKLKQLIEANTTNYFPVSNVESLELTH